MVQLQGYLHCMLDRNGRQGCSRRAGQDQFRGTVLSAKTRHEAEEHGPHRRGHARRPERIVRRELRDHRYCPLHELQQRVHPAVAFEGGPLALVCSTVHLSVCISALGGALGTFALLKRSGSDVDERFEARKFGV